MDKKLIVTADDFGVSPGVNRAVYDAHRSGVLTSAALMAIGPALGEAVEMTRSLPDLDIGLHFGLTAGHPVSDPQDISSLVDKDGRFLRRPLVLRRALNGQLRREHVERELEAQLNRLKELGINTSYINGDQHVHLLPIVRDVVVDQAARSGLAVRIPCEEQIWALSLANSSGWRRIGSRFVLKALLRLLARGLARRCRDKGVVTNDAFQSPAGLWPSPQFTVEAYRILLGRLQGVLTELMVHPSYPDRITSTFWVGAEAKAQEREIELATLLDPKFPSILDEVGASLTTYAKAIAIRRLT